MASKNPTNTHEITQLLERWGEGDHSVEEQLFPMVYEELRRIARGYLRHERPDHTLNTTSLVHEAYLVLEKQEHVTWQNRKHFYGVAAIVMRRALLNYAERRNAQKRGGGIPDEPLHEHTQHLSDTSPARLIELDDALNRLGAINNRWTQVVEFYYYCDLQIDEIANVLDLSPSTIKRDLRFARQWLRSEMSPA